MSNPGEVDATPISTTEPMVAWLESGCKPASDWRIGTEHEKFGFRHADLLPPPYDTDAQGAPGIGAMLEGLAARGARAGHGWERIEDAGALIGLARDGGSISLEPAGQFELSGAPLADLHQTRMELEAHLAEVGELADTLGLGFAPLGFHPFATRAQMPWMPKGRYAIMRRYMPKVGGLGLDMMQRTCTVQVNLDFASEADMVRKLRTSMLLQPVATALFANSPFTEGRPNGYLSYRAQVWNDTDPDRTGMPAAFFEAGFGFERYAEWLLDMPMYFIHRQDGYHDLAGASFRDYLAGRLPQLPGQRPTMSDFTDHVTTAFTEVRLKRYLEMRGADAGRPEMMLAQSAFWVGLLYDPAALEAAYRLASEHDWRDYEALRRVVPRQGLAARWGSGSLRDLAGALVTIAGQGLAARARIDRDGHHEGKYLEPLMEIIAGGPVQAEDWLSRVATEWGGDVRPMLGAAARMAGGARRRTAEPMIG